MIPKSPRFSCEVELNNNNYDYWFFRTVKFSPSKHNDKTAFEHSNQFSFFTEKMWKNFSDR